MERISLVNDKKDCCDAPSYMVRRRTGKIGMGEGDALTTSGSGSTEKMSSRISSDENEEDEEVEGDCGITTDLLTSSSYRMDHHQNETSVTRHHKSTDTKNLG
uniref:Uncharacterized protein n=1 Tax=Lygus hesperus TaxID=30085 RepID=A0A0A9XAZ3_LYGHE